MQLGFSASDLEGIGARGLKTTCFSWASKAGVPREHRRLLGYHVELGDKSVETYARDSLAAPLRSLDEVLEKIRAGKFDPDSTRSGFLKRGEEASEQAAASAKVSESSSTCPSVVSSASSMGTEDEDLATIPDEVEAVESSGTVIRNVSTNCLHILAGPDRLRCGRRVPKAHEVILDVPPEARVCPMCF